MRAGAAASAFVFLLGAAPAHADYRVCNTTKVMANVAVGHAVGDDFGTQGWWTVAPGDCATPIRGQLTGRYVYVYAVGVDSRELFPGGVSMCVDRVKFELTGVADCWRRGLMSVAFYEIDTGNATDWTTFLGDAGK